MMLHGFLLFIKNGISDWHNTIGAVIFVATSLPIDSGDGEVLSAKLQRLCMAADAITVSRSGYLVVRAGNVGRECRNIAEVEVCWLETWKFLGKGCEES